MTATTTITAADHETLRDLLAFEAPYVSEKLLVNKTVRSLEEGKVLFDEAKKYLWLIATDRERDYPIMSLRVDEAWHQFLLFTLECQEFCQRFFGCFMNHAPPTKALAVPGAKVRPVVTREKFAARYLEVFGVELPDVWSDELSVDPAQRVVANEGSYSVRTREGHAELVETGPESERVRMRIDAWAEPALRFVLEKGIFYVREVPLLEPEESVELCRALVKQSVLVVVA